MPIVGEETFAKVVGAKELPLRAKLVPTDERRRQIVKRPKWLPWESSETKSGHLKKCGSRPIKECNNRRPRKKNEKKISPPRSAPP
jgi:hypothetical protein